MKLIKLDSNKSWAGKTLVLPSGNSLRNACELAVDALIVHSNAKRCGFLRSSAFLPVVIPNCFGQSGVTTATEFYEVDNLLILQLRAPFATLQGKQAFTQFLINLIQEEQLKEIICLATVSAHLRGDDALRNSEAFMRVLNYSDIDNECKLPKLEEPEISLKYGGGIAEDLAQHGIKILCMYGSEAIDMYLLYEFTNTVKKYIANIEVTFQEKIVESWGQQIPRPPISIY